MSLLYLDNMESLPTGSILTNTISNGYFKNFTIRTGSDLVNDFVVNTGHISERCLRIAQDYSKNFTYMTYKGDVSNKIVTVGFAFSYSNNYTNTLNGAIPSPLKDIIISFSNDFSSYLRIGEDYSLIIGDLVTSSGTITEAEYSYLEITVDLTNGAFELFVNNVSYGTGIMLLGDNKFIRFGQDRVTSRPFKCYFYDDIYILDNEGTVNNSRLGPIRVKNLPLKETVMSNFTPNNAIDNLSAVNKTVSDTASFNRSNIDNDLGDSFKVDTSSIPIDTNIVAVQQTATYRNTDFGTRSLILTVKKDDVEKSTTLPERFFTFGGTGTTNLLETTPNGETWDIDKINDTEFGYKVR